MRHPITKTQLDATFIKAAGRIVEHHERLDESGYPYLSADAIAEA